jgi:hypothetical protein
MRVYLVRQYDNSSARRVVKEAKLCQLYPIGVIFYQTEVL